MFSFCVVLVFAWSIRNLLRAVPAYLLRLDPWEMVGFVAYTQAFALLESVAFLLVLLLLAVVLPARFFRDRFVAQGTMLVLATFGWSYAAIRWHLDLLLWIPLYLISVACAYACIHHFERLENLIFSVVERLSVLAIVLVPIGVLSVVVVVIRNF
jgi:hypothetical protein